MTDPPGIWLDPKFTLKDSSDKLGSCLVFQAQFLRVNSMGFLDPVLIGRVLISVQRETLLTYAHRG